MPRVATPPLFLMLACGLAACANDASPKAASRPAAAANPPISQPSSPGSPAELACVAVAMSVPAATLDDATSVASPETAYDMADAMHEIADAFGQVMNISAAQWQVPADQPDIVPAAEARRLTDNLRLVAQVPEAQAKGEDFSRLLIQSIERAAAIEDLIARSAPTAETDAAFKLVEASCNECHAKYASGE